LPLRLFALGAGAGGLAGLLPVVGGVVGAAHFLVELASRLSYKFLTGQLTEERYRELMAAEE
jgi:hypothetical protein